jgi:Skp family chaperone for outer membrane proteins
MLFAFVVACGIVLGIACSDDNGADDLGPIETPSVPRTVLPSPPASNTDATKDEFVAKVNNQIERMEGRIAEIEAESQKLTGAAREEADRQVQELKDEVEDLRARLTDFEGAGPQDLDSIRRDIDARLNETATRVESLADQLGI